MSFPDRFTTYVITAFLVLGAIFLVIAGVTFYEQRSFIAESTPHTGKVVDVILSPDQRRAAPVVAYTWQNQEKTHKGRFSQGFFTLQKGETVPLYVHERTGEALIDTFGERWLVPGIFSLLGVCFVVVPLLVGYLMRR